MYDSVSDFTKVFYNFSYPMSYGDSVAVVARKLQSAGWLASFNDTGDEIISFRYYKACSSGAMISVGPLEEQTLGDFEQLMAIMFWGTVYPTLEVLPAMRARRSGRIVNITSIGGKVSVPHLLPYSTAKFAAVGFSEGLRAELARDGIVVTTVAPGLMRTGSHLNALFKGQHRQEFGWFSLGASLPITSTSAEGAARRIVTALARGEAELILTWQANLLAVAHGLLPGLTSDVLGLVNRVLPGPGGVGSQSVTGWASQSPLSDSPLEALGREAAATLNQT